MSPGEAAFRLAYEISPIYLTGGLAGSVPGATTPLISYTEGNLFGLGGLFGALANFADLDNFFAHFLPVPGSTLVENAIGVYPFANQSVAANAIIFEPLMVSMMMICPARPPVGFAARQAIFTALKQTLDAHNLAGGTYTVATPAYLYIDCILTRLTDASGGETRQPQYRYQFDFRRPLISQEEAQQSYNNQMSILGRQTQFQLGADGQLPSSGAGLGVQNPASGIAPSVSPLTRADLGLGWAPRSPLDTFSTSFGFGSASDTAVSVPADTTGATAPNSSQIDITTSSL